MCRRLVTVMISFICHKTLQINCNYLFICKLGTSSSSYFTWRQRQSAELQVYIIIIWYYWRETSCCWLHWQCFHHWSLILQVSESLTDLFENFFPYFGGIFNIFFMSRVLLHTVIFNTLALLQCQSYQQTLILWITFTLLKPFLFK